MSPDTRFFRLNIDWNAEPNGPEPEVRIEGNDLILEFDLNPWQYPRFAEGQRGRLVFRQAWRYHMAGTNDEGFLRGQCRFSKLAPGWGEFYEVDGDLLLAECEAEWIHVVAEPPSDLRHFLFYFRDEAFECDARDWSFEERMP